MKSTQFNLRAWRAAVALSASFLGASTLQADEVFSQSLGHSLGPFSETQAIFVPDQYVSATEEFVEAAPRNLAEALIRRAKTQVHSRYTRGGSSPETGFDCSGFILWAFRDLVEKPMPHSALALYQLAAPKVAKKDLQPGDLLFFQIYGNRVSHVAIYIGKGKMIHATRPGSRLRVESMEWPYWQRSYVGSNRPLASTLINKSLSNKFLASTQQRSSLLDSLSGAL